MGAPGMIIGSTIFGALGQVAAGQQRKAIHNRRAAISETNANLAEQRGKNAYATIAQQIESRIAQIQRAGASSVGETTTAIAASGVQVSGGTAADVQADEMMKVARAQDDMIVKGGRAQREAVTGATVEAWNLRAGADVERMRGDEAMTQAWAGAGQTVLGGAYKYKQIA